ncbi:MAG: cytochrome c3 family protein [Phycisphaerae bacterium]|nr:cytochrome c3 family protein [Phycisphaerae bacterium]
MMKRNITGLFFMLGCFLYAVEKPTTLEETCVTAECHTTYKEKAYLHGPMELNDCRACHKPDEPSQHTWKLLQSVTDLCQSCHLEVATMKNVHEPLKTGDCLQCHDPHSSDNKFFLHEKTIAEQCAECHDPTAHKAFLHGPVAVGECTICHDSHSSDYTGLLKVEPKELCFSCHTITADELKNFEYIHEPAKGECVGCHNPHGADNAQMIKGGLSDICFSCHEDIQDIAKAAKVQHNMITEEGGCLKCHTPHASTVKKLLKNDSQTLCLSCHDKPQEIGDGKTMPAFTSELNNKMFLHGPVAEKDCNGCHLAHGSDHFRLLIKEYPPKFYAPYSVDEYALCYSCHPDALTQTERTTDLTDFRNGNQNLHYLHVNKEYRGRTCRACHQTHASNLPKHIRETVPYGMWELPVQFEKTETGGVCTPGCHVAKEYDRKKPVDYSRQQGTVSRVE